MELDMSLQWRRQHFEGRGVVAEYINHYLLKIILSLNAFTDILENV